MTIDDLEHARTGTSAVERPRARALAGEDRRGRAAAAPKFSVVDLVPQHDEQADEELARDGDLRLRVPAAMAQRAVGALQISVDARSVWGRLAEDPAAVQLGRDGALRLLVPGLMSHGAVGALQISVDARIVWGRLAEDPAEQRAALFGDMAEAILVRGRMEARGQPDIAHDVFGI